MKQFVTIVNQDPDEPYIGKYDGEYITIPAAGGRKTVEYDVMVVWMGDPKVENTERYQERREVFNRICSLHHARGLTGNEPELLPQLEAYDEDGNRIITVMDDPDGVNLVPDAGEQTDIGKLQRQIERLQRQVDEQVAGLVDEPAAAPEHTPFDDIIEAQDAAVEEEDVEDELDIPEDTPTKVRVSDAPPATVASPKAAAKKAPTKAPTGRSRGTAGTAGKRAASRAK